MDEAARHDHGGLTMMVLTRKRQESVVVGGSDTREPMLTVTVLDISGGKVRLGFEGNSNVPVHRSEVWERIRTNGGRKDQPPRDGMR